MSFFFFFEKKESITRYEDIKKHKLQRMINELWENDAGNDKISGKEWD